MTVQEIVAVLKSHANRDNAAAMARYGISPVGTLGVNIPTIRSIARRAGRDHGLALALWNTGIHEARILAAMVDEPAKVTRRQMNRWAADFDSWDVVDGVCGELFDETRHAYAKAMQWSGSRREYVKRAGFVLMAQLAMHDKPAPDDAMLLFLPVIVRESGDERNFVKKAVNWALRQIGKRNRRLNAAAIAAAREILALDTRAGRWIARDALRELASEAAQRRLKG